MEETQINKIESKKDSYLISVFKFFRLGFKLSLKNINYNTSMLYIMTFLRSYIFYYIAIIYSQIIEGISTKSDRSVLEVIFIWYVTLQFTSFIFERVFQAIIDSPEILNSRSKLSCFKDLLQKDMDFYDKENPSLVLDKMQIGYEVLHTFKPENFIFFIRCLINFSLYFWVVFSTDKIIFAFTCLSIFWISRSAATKFKNESQENEKVEKIYKDSTSHFYDCLTNIRLIKAFSVENRVIQKAKYYLDLMIGFDKNSKQSSNVPIKIFMREICNIFVLWYGGRKVLAGSYDFASFTLIQLNVSYINDEYAMFSSYLNETVGNVSKAENFLKFLDTKVNLDFSKSVLKKEISGKIQFLNVDFSYPSSKEAKILRKLDLTINSGEVVALVGPSGCGKVRKIFKIFILKLSIIFSLRLQVY